MYSVWYEKQTVIQFQPSYTVQFSGLHSMCDQMYLSDKQTESKLKGHVSLEVNFTFPMMPIWHVHLWNNYEKQKTGWSLVVLNLFVSKAPIVYNNIRRPHDVSSCLRFKVRVAFLSFQS